MMSKSSNPDKPKERPILFGAPMVRALLDGTKTQTRRLVKPAPDLRAPITALENVRGGFIDSAEKQFACPYGQPGDRLWVRETCFINDFQGAHVPPEERADCEIFYRATDEQMLMDQEDTEGLSWRPSIHMPRWASRILLEVVSVRVERLQDISEADARAEGVRHSLHLPTGRDARGNFEHLWWTINGAGSWDANPWVWVVEFKRVPL